MPNRKLSDSNWCAEATTEEKRKLAHKILSYPIGNYHDACLILINIGNKDSIPYLVNSLKWQGNTNEDDIVICTKDHCLEALQKLTGKNLGYNYSDWKNWDKIENR